MGGFVESIFVNAFSGSSRLPKLRSHDLVTAKVMARTPLSSPCGATHVKQTPKTNILVSLYPFEKARQIISADLSHGISLRGFVGL